MKRRGFTLLEVIIAGFMFAVIVAAVAGFSAFYFQNYSFSYEEQQSVGQLQYAITQMVRDIREARSGDDGAWPITTTTDTQFVFFSDVTGDGRTDKVRYFLDGTDLKRGIIEPTAVPVTYPPANEKIKVMVGNINLNGKPMFTYYNGNWPADTVNNPLPAASRLLSTRLVGVYLRIDISSNSGSQPYEASSSVQMRSMKDNL
jgi:prepilin-type N-terminal cleavage/methylation domain-containing protein